MFHLADTPQKVGNIHRAISFVYSYISSIQFTSEIQLFGLRTAVNAMFLSSLFSKQPRFQSNITSISLAVPIKYTVESTAYGSTTELVCVLQSFLCVVYKFI